MRTLNWGILSNSVGPRIRLLRNHLSARSIAVSEPFGLPTGSLTVLALIAQNPGGSQKHLAGMAGITGPSLVSIIDELESREMVTRERSTIDRRRNMLLLTPSGEEAMNALYAEVNEIERPIQDVLGPEDLKIFLDLLDRVIATSTNE